MVTIRLAPGVSGAGKGCGSVARYTPLPAASATKTFGTPSGPGRVGPEGSITSLGGYVGPWVVTLSS